VTREEDEDDDDLGLVTVPLKLKFGMNLSNGLWFKVFDRPRSSHRGSRTTSGDADDSVESSPPTSMSTMSAAPSPAGVDMALSGAASSDGAVVVRSEATGSDGAMKQPD
jgi:hypothetical protein